MGLGRYIFLREFPADIRQTMQGLRGRPALQIALSDIPIRNCQRLRKKVESQNTEKSRIGRPFLDKDGDR